MQDRKQIAVTLSIGARGRRGISEVIVPFVAVIVAVVGVAIAVAIAVTVVVTITAVVIGKTMAVALSVVARGRRGASGVIVIFVAVIVAVIEVAIAVIIVAVLLSESKWPSRSWSLRANSVSKRGHCAFCRCYRRRCRRRYRRHIPPSALSLDEPSQVIA
ncbi:MAG: hypothetical protein ACR2P7_01340 [bacterium]